MSICRQIGADTARALALLAVYLLVLLAPLHQVSAMQRDLGKLGFETAGAWSICAPLADDSEGETDIRVVKCPAQGIGKDDLALSKHDSGNAWLSRVHASLQALPPTDLLLISACNLELSGPRAPPRN